MQKKSRKYYEVVPQIALNWSYNETVSKIKKLIGSDNLFSALNIDKKYPSPVKDENDSDWIKTVKIMGINPRIAGTYFNIVKYALTFPEDTIHIMPVWEIGCGGGIYARVNWKLSDDWLDNELIEKGYDTSEKQLKLVVNLLHAIGKKVGFDVTCHTDKYSEEVFIVPECFEWIKLNDKKTIQVKYSDTDEVYPQLKQCIKGFLINNNCADGSSFINITNFDELSYEEKSKILFGIDLTSRTTRRILLMNYVRNCGFETIPVTEHAPCRPIVFKEIKYDANGNNYADFEVPNKSSSALIFNSITPYRWYKINADGYPDINHPIECTFNYFFEKVSEFQKTYNFDFFRGDMAHNQISHSHSKKEKDEHFEFEMWKQLKEHIQKKVPYFATFAEAFFGDYYISGIQDLINKKFDIAVGASNFKFLDNSFIDIIKVYFDITRKFGVSPCITSITNDSDRKENNIYHQSPLANEIRYFVQMFLQLPSYTGMGFEVRKLQPENEFEYSGAYTNYMSEKYKWGNNIDLFKAVSKIRRMFSKISESGLKSDIIPTLTDNALCWILYKNNRNNPLYFCLININTTKDFIDINFETDSGFDLSNKKLVPVFSLRKNPFIINSVRVLNGCIRDVDFADARIYKVKNRTFSFADKKNKNQILVVSTECTPYSKSGGLADVCSEFPSAFKTKYHKDIRVIIPMYNTIDPDCGYIELADKYNNENPVRFETVDTGIKTEYKYGIDSSYTRLFKIKNPVNNICTYLVYSPVFSSIKKEYEGDLIEFSASYTASVCALLKKLKNSTEKFNPYIIQTHDHLTANTNILINNMKRYDSFYENIKTIHTLHNITDTGRIFIVNAFLKLFSPQQIQDICDDNEIKILLKSIQNNNKVENPLQYIYSNINNIKNDENIELLLHILKNKFEHKLVNENYYSVTKQVIKCCNYWTTVSTCIYNELINDIYDFAGDFYKLYSEKGIGILSGLNKNDYNPNNDIKYPYSIKNFKTEKLKNKLYLQQQFSLENIKVLNIDKNLFSDYKNAKIQGFLYPDENYILILFASRLEAVKGFDIIKKIIPDILSKYNKVQFILAGKNISEVSDFQKYIDSGRLLIIDDFIPIKQYFASSDIFLNPSMSETCGLAIMQSMKYGTPPVSGLTGCAGEIIVSIDENSDNANGFKTKKSLFKDDNAVSIYKEKLTEAITVFSSDDNLKNKIIENCFKTNTDWNDDILQKYYNVFYSEDKK